MGFVAPRPATPACAYNRGCPTCCLFVFSLSMTTGSNFPEHGARAMLPALRRAVVKVLAASDPPDYEQPWQTTGVEHATGSGVIVETRRGLRILTNAHVVENQVFLEVRRFGRSNKFVAHLEGIGHDCDLALLRVDKPEFFEGAEPIPIGGLPSLADRVTVLGFPIGGDRLSVTEGVVSRIEMVPYTQSQRRLLAIQIDAAINAGNSGGPVAKDGRLIGLAFQALEDAENIGYVIAAPVIEHFLADMDNGVFDGFPSLGVYAQPLESRSHRQALGLPQEHRGVLINQVAYEGSGYGVMRRGDVLLSVDGVPVSSDGTVSFRRGERIDMTHVAASRHVGERIPVTVWRGGVELTCTLKLKPPKLLVPENRHEAKPEYLLYGGLLFAPLTRDYLKTWGEDWWESAPRHLLALYENGVRTRERREVVLLQKVLADEVNRGYHDMESMVITRVQGQRIRCMCDLHDALARADGDFVRFTTADHMEIVIDRQLAAQRHAAILERYGVPQDTSEGLPDGCAAA